MTSIKLYNVTSQEAAGPIIAALSGVTVRLCPAAGGFDIYADVEGDAAEAQALLFGLLCRAIRAAV